MSEAKPPCDCLECRIRRACGFAENVPIDIQPAAYALGNVFAELLAFVPARTAKMMVAELLVARRKWLKNPRVAAQQPPAGHA